MHAVIIFFIIKKKKVGEKKPPPTKTLNLGELQQWALIRIRKKSKLELENSHHQPGPGNSIPVASC